MYDIVELNGKLVNELREIAKTLDIKRAEGLKKQELIFRILDEQALLPVKPIKAGESVASEKKIPDDSKTKRGRKPRSADTRDEKPTPAKPIEKKSEPAQPAKESEPATPKAEEPRRQITIIKKPQLPAPEKSEVVAESLDQPAEPKPEQPVAKTEEKPAEPRKRGRGRPPKAKKE
jgi:transcription termination factor Rho